MSQKQITSELLKQLIQQAEENTEGNTANYIPELAHVNKNITAIAVQELGSPPL